MSLISVYRQAMEVNSISDMVKREAAAKALFQNLNKMTLPETFNWAAELFENVHVQERGDQLGLIWADLEGTSERKFSYKEVAANGNRLLNFLRKQGVKQGDNQYMFTPIAPETWFATFAGLKGGLVTVPTATSATEHEIRFRFKTYKPDVILTSEALAGVVDAALTEVGHKPKAKIVLGNKAGWVSYGEVGGESPEAAPAVLKVGDMVFCFFTSGTTGLPKRVGHSAVSSPLGHLSTAIIQGVEPGGVHHNLSAPGWAKWAWSSFFAPLNLGATASGFNFGALKADTYLAAIAKYKVNTFCAPPTAWRVFVTLDLTKFDLSAIKYSLSAGEPLNPEVIDQWQKVTGTVIRDFYGQTESTAMIGNPPWMEDKMRLGSFGYPSPMYDAILMDDEGQEITAVDEPGRIAIRLSNWRSIGLFEGYIGDPERTKAAFQNNLYDTGDKAYIDKDGYWWFVGRSDDVIKSSDFRVGPFEVESALIEHPAVLEAAVVGSPDPSRYQLVKAYVVLKQGRKPSKELALELFQHTIKVLAKFKIPRIIEFVDDLPKTISGKIRRVQLRDQEVKKKGEDVKEPNEYFYQQFPELSSKKK